MFGQLTSQGCQNLTRHPRDLKMVAKRPGWTYLNLEILTGQLRCLKMAQSVKSSPGGVDPPPPPGIFRVERGFKTHFHPKDGTS